MPVFFEFENEDFEIFSEEFVSLWILNVLKLENKKLGNITYSIISDESILEINNQFLNHNYFTDIITFNYSLVNIINGDIYISFDTVKSNSNKFNTSLLNEMYRVIIHGIMHLCSYDDCTEKEKIIMRNKEDYYLSYLEKL